MPPPPTLHGLTRTTLLRPSSCHQLSSSHTVEHRAHHGSWRPLCSCCPVKVLKVGVKAFPKYKIDLHAPPTLHMCRRIRAGGKQEVTAAVTAICGHHQEPGLVFKKHHFPLTLVTSEHLPSLWEGLSSPRYLSCKYPHRPTQGHAS